MPIKSMAWRCSDRDSMNQRGLNREPGSTSIHRMCGRAAKRTAAPREGAPLPQCRTASCLPQRVSEGLARAFRGTKPGYHTVARALSTDAVSLHRTTGEAAGDPSGRVRRRTTTRELVRSSASGPGTTFRPTVEAVSRSLSRREALYNGYSTKREVDPGTEVTEGGSVCAVTWKPHWEPGSTLLHSLVMCTRF